ncbi:hypothetical protein ACFE04_026448 [Oxalis oulophora]
MENRWTGILKVPLNKKNTHYYRVAASLCFSSAFKSVSVRDRINVIFFNGDRVQGTGNQVIERLSDLQTLADILVSKFSGRFVNVWVIEAAFFNGPFAVYKDFIPSVNRFGEPRSYSPIGFPAASTTFSILSTSLEMAKNAISRRQKEPFSISTTASDSPDPKTILLGFSKGGTVLNQLLTELSSTELSSTRNSPERPNIAEVCRGQETQVIPRNKESLLDSITEIHYVDVGLNSTGAYLTDHNVIEKLSKRPAGIRFVLHGTPRQWCDSQRPWIREEKDKLIHLLETEAQKTDEKLQACERFYFADKEPNLQMHFEIIDSLDIS